MNGVLEEKHDGDFEADCSDGWCWIRCWHVKYRSCAGARRQEVVRSCDNGRRRSLYDRPKGGAAPQVKCQSRSCPTRGRKKKGAREVKPGAVIYKQGGKLYMLEEPQNQ